MLPNKLIRSHLLILEDLLGKNGVKALLNLTNLSEWIENYPSDNEAREVQFDIPTRIQDSLQEIYGPRMGRNLMRRAARQAFEQVGKELMSLDAYDSSTASSGEQVEDALKRFRQLLSIDAQASNHVTHDEGRFSLRLVNCPNCIEREADEPMCDAYLGWLEGLLSLIGVSEEFDCEETACLASGDKVCEFSIAPVAA